MQPLRVEASTTISTAITAYTHACNWHMSVMASFKRQPEKKDALLMRRRGPCSEKARRGLQSWENPAQHKQKHGKEEREEEGRDKKTWTMVSEWVRRNAGCLLSSDHLRFLVWDEILTIIWLASWLVGQSVRQTERLVSLTEKINIKQLNHFRLCSSDLFVFSVRTAEKIHKRTKSANSSLYSSLSHSQPDLEGVRVISLLYLKTKYLSCTMSNM